LPSFFVLVAKYSLQAGVDEYFQFVVCLRLGLGFRAQGSGFRV
jgi:hypothetical protein